MKKQTITNLHLERDFHPIFFTLPNNPSSKPRFVRSNPGGATLLPQHASFEQSPHPPSSRITARNLMIYVNSRAAFQRCGHSNDIGRGEVNYKRRSRIISVGAEAQASTEEPQYI